MQDLEKLLEMCRNFFPQKIWVETSDTQEPRFQSLIKQLRGELEYYSGINQSLISLEIDNTNIEYRFYRTVQSMLQNVDLLLDLGGGARPFRLVDSRIHVLVESYRPYLKYLQNHSFGENLILVSSDEIGRAHV